jgi:hypothetical protein
MQEEIARLAKMREINPKKGRNPPNNNDPNSTTLQVINLFEQAKSLKSDTAKSRKRVQTSLTKSSST